MNTRISNITHLPFTAEVSAQLSNHISDITSFQEQIASLTHQYPHARILKEALSDARCAYRWLKARSFHIKQAVQMITDAIKYREKYELDTILIRPFPMALEIRKLSADSWHGYDAHGSPIFIQRFGQLDLTSLAALASADERLMYYHYLNEYTQSIILSQASIRAGHHVDTVTSIFDMSGLSMHIITKYNTIFVRQTIAASSLIYPESMQSCYIINTPRVFTLAWAAVRSFIDEATRQKINMSKDNGEKMYREAGIDMRHFPIALGGECQCADKNDSDGWNGCIHHSTQVLAFEAYIKEHSQESDDDDDDAHSKAKAIAETLTITVAETLTVTVADDDEMYLNDTDSDESTSTPSDSMDSTRKHSHSNSNSTSHRESVYEEHHRHAIGTASPILA
jgi:hypothetical protein